MSTPVVAWTHDGRGLDAVARDLASCPRSGWVRVTGLADVGDVRAALSLAADSGHRVQPVASFDALADAGALRGLVAEGLTALAVPFDGPGGQGARVLAAAGGVDHLKVTVMMPAGVRTDVADAWIACAQEAGADVEVWPAVGDAEQAGEAEMIAGAEALWAAASDRRVPVRLFDLGLAPPPVPPDHAPARVTPALVDALRGGVPLAGPRQGVVVDDAAALEALGTRVGSVPDAARLFAAVGWPLLELPRCQGGAGRGPGGPRCRMCPGGPACAGGGTDDDVPEAWTGVREGASVHVVLPYLGDRITTQGTFPGLVRALRSRGADVTFHSAWHRPTHPQGWDPDAPLRYAEVDPAVDDHAKAHRAPFARGLDFTGADLVIAPGFDWGALVWRHPRLPPGARLVIADDHMYLGLDAWKRKLLPEGARSLVTAWWPSPRVHVHSAFPGHAKLAWYAGVPSRNLWWRPYPLCLEAFPEAPPASSCTELLAAGNHLRDHETLGEAVAQLGGATRVTLVSQGRPRTIPEGLDREGPLPLPAFVERIAQARVVVVVAEHHPDRTSGQSVITLARGVGRPVIATSTPGLLEYVRHDEDGWLVPAGDPRALAAALARAAEDDAWIDRLAAGARRAAARADVGVWADHLVHGGVGGPIPDAATGGAPWRMW